MANYMLSKLKARLPLPGGRAFFCACLLAISTKGEKIMATENAQLLQPTDQETWDAVCNIKRPDYEGKAGFGNLSALPFYESYDNPWSVDPTDDYGEACEKGMEYAAHFAMYVHHHRSLSALQRIAHEVDLSDKRRMGYAIGFFSFLEEIITDPFFWVPYYKKYLWRDRQYELREEARKKHRASQQFIDYIWERANILERMQQHGGAS